VYLRCSPRLLRHAFTVEPTLNHDTSVEQTTKVERSSSIKFPAVLVLCFSILVAIALYLRCFFLRKFQKKRVPAEQHVKRPRKIAGKLLVIGNGGFGCAQLSFSQSSIAAFRRALEYKLDGVRAEVRVTQDRIFIVSHEDHFQARRIGEWEWSDLKQRCKDFVTLDQILELMPDYVYGTPRIFSMILDLSSVEFTSLKVLEQLMRSIEHHHHLSRVAVLSSPHQAAIANCHVMFKQMKLPHPPDLAFSFGAALSLPSDFLSRCRRIGVAEIHCSFQALSVQVLRTISEAGFQAMALPTPNEPDKIRALKQLIPLCKHGLSAVCCNSPELLHSILLIERFERRHQEFFNVADPSSQFWSRP